MKLSIIVPVYNLQEYINSTIRSLAIMKLSFKYEIIIVNDGSTDNSGVYLEQLEKEFDNVKLITISNSGVSFARNVGLRNCSGQYITFVDGDDTIESEFLEKAVYLLDNNNYDFVQCNYKIIFEDHFEFSQHANRDILVDSKAKMLDLFLGDNKLIYNAVWGKVYKAETVYNLMFDVNLKVAEDKKFVFDVINNSQNALIMEYIGYHYYQRKSSVMHNLDEGKHFNRLYVCEYLKKNCNSNSMLNNINIDELSIYISLYKLAKKKKKSGNEYYECIKEMHNVVILRNENIRFRLVVFLLVHARGVFDSILRIRGNGE